ncbi:MAG: type II secretion system F family protein [Candidatus Eremiobacterota bacterium]
MATPVKKPQRDERWMSKARCHEEAKILFTRQLGAMLRTGIPITRSLETLTDQVEDPGFKRVIEKVYQRVCEGAMLSHSMNQFPRIFSNMYVSMVRIGENTGGLADSLEMLGAWMERDYNLVRKVKSALTYPVFVLALSAVLTLGLFYYILPGFVKIFDDMKVPLPLITKVMIVLTNWIRNPGMWLVGAGVATGLYFWLREYLSQESGRLQVYRVALWIPVLGPMLSQAALARFCCSMQALLTVGVDLAPGLKLSLAASGSPILAKDGVIMSQHLIEGVSLSEYMQRRPDIYPASVVQMLSAGEETSQLDQMFGRLGTFYNEEVNYLIEGFSAVLEPVLLASVAVVVGTIVLSIFLPLYGYLGKLGS